MEISSIFCETETKTVTYVTSTYKPTLGVTILRRYVLPLGGKVLPVGFEVVTPYGCYGSQFAHGDPSRFGC